MWIILLSLAVKKGSDIQVIIEILCWSFVFTWRNKIQSLLAVSCLCNVFFLKILTKNHVYHNLLCHRNICDAVAFGDSHLCVCMRVCYSSCEKPLVQFQPNLAGLFLGEGLPKLFKEFDSMQKSCCHGNQQELYEQILKIFL
jgi:hypothetical protein